MSSSNCRFALHVGLSAISYIKVERSGSAWRVVSSGYTPTQNLNTNPKEARQGLHELLSKLFKQQGLARETLHVSLHNRMCITRVVTGNRQQVDEQLAEITDNSQHYLQLGLGEKLLGHATVPIDESRQHGQVAIIKKGLIETIDTASSQAGLTLVTVDGALSSICRLVGLAGLDRTPLLLIWKNSHGAEIGISYKGRLQLNYHSGQCVDIETTAATVGKHLKRLRRFCERYRQVDGRSDLRRVLVLTKNGESDSLKESMAGYDFEQILTLDDLNQSNLSDKLVGQPLCSAGAASALGGLLVHLEPNVLPTTDLFDQYLAAKPQSWRDIVLRDGWPLLAAAALLLMVLAGERAMSWRVQTHQTANASVESDFDRERVQLVELDQQRRMLNEYRRVVAKVQQPSLRELVSQIATCLPGDCRLDWCGLENQGRLVLKGTMLQGDQTYEVLKALRDLPQIGEVALESVESSSNQGRTATNFEIHCELTAQPAQSNVNHKASSGPAHLTGRWGSPKR